MKKWKISIVAALLLMLCLFSTACIGKAAIPEYAPGSIKLLPDKEVYSSLISMGVRSAYLTIPLAVVYIVSDEPYFEGDGSELSIFFEEWLSNTRDGNYEMMAKAFVQHFNIPKEDFVAAIEKEREEAIARGIDLTEEENELPNPDIVYTFDEEIIKHYYRREG